MSDESNVLKFNARSKEYNFQDFGRACMQKDYELATRVLRDILQLDYDKAKLATDYFVEKLEETPNLVMQAMQIRYKIIEKQQNEALLLIQEVFGITGADSVKALESMTKIVEQSLESDS